MSSDAAALWLKSGNQVDDGQDSLQGTVVAYVSLHLSSPGVVLARRDPRRIVRPDVSMCTAEFGQHLVI